MFIEDLSFGIALRISALVLCSLAGSGSGEAAVGHGLMVVAPHPDDEVLGCGGIIQQALAQGRQVTVVVLTSGDAFPAAAAGLTKKPVDKLIPDDYLKLSRFRAEQTRSATKILGVKPDAVVFLGYPNGGLAELYAGTAPEPFRLSFTQKDATYCLVQRDYHTAVHGQPAPYTHASLLGDTAELIKSRQPEEVYVTAEQDGHPDHRAAYFIVRDAIQAAQQHCALYTFLVHGGSGHQWPWPRGVDPRSPLQAHEVDGKQVPAGLPWPPPKRVSITPRQAQLKLKAIRAHRLYFSDPEMDQSHQANMESFVKSEEVFWEPARK